MAIDLQEVFNIRADEGRQNLAQLRNEINELKNALFALQEGSEEYNQVALEVHKRQQKIAEVMQDTKRPFESAKGSFNALNDELRVLKEMWKATGDEMQRGKLTEQINEVKAKMNAMNESIGNYQHNVGNYSSSIIEAFQKMGISVTGLTAPLKKMGVDIESIDTHIKILSGTIKIFGGQNLAMLQKMFAGATAGTKAFIVGLSGIQKALLATGIGAFIVLLGALIAHWSDLNTWLGKVTDSQHAFTIELNKTTGAINSLSLRIAEFNKDQEAIEKERRRLFEGWTDVDFAADEIKKAQKLQKDAVDTLNKAAAEKEEAGRRLQEAQDKYDNAIDAEAKQLYEQDIADRLANWTKAANNFNEAARQVGEAERAVKNMEQNLANVTKAAEDAADKTDKYGAAAKQAAQEAHKALEKLQQQALGILAELEQASLTPLEKVQAAYDKDKDTLQRAYNEGLMNYEDYEKGLLLLQDRYSKQRNDIIDADIKAARNRADEEQKERQAAAEAKAEADKEALAHDEEMRRMRAEAEESASNGYSVWDYDTIAAQYDAELEAFKANAQAKMDINTQLMEQYDENSKEYQALERENERIAAEVTQAEVDNTNKKQAAWKKMMDARVGVMQDMSKKTSTILNAVSKAFGENTKMGKGFAIASATIDTIASAVAGFRAGYNQWKDAPGPLAAMAPIQGAINAAAALAAGYAQVQSLKSVDTSGNGGGGGATATAMAIPNIEGLSSPVDYTRQVTTETEKEEMNRDNRVYILESDIQQSNNRVRVREEETTF